MIARDIKFEVSLDRQDVAIGEASQLRLTFYNTRATVPAPDLGSISGLEIRYLGPSTMMTVINGKVSSSITHIYSVLPLKTGRFQLGPFPFNYKGDEYTSNIAFLNVAEDAYKAARQKEDAARPQDKKSPALSASLNLEDRLFLALSSSKAEAYVNELIPVTVKVYVNRMNVSEIQLPSFDQEGFSKAEFKEPKQYREELNGIIYDVLEFKTNIFATRQGEYNLGPAKVKCNLVVKKKAQMGPSRIDDFFGDDYSRDDPFGEFFTRYERHPVELKSDPIPLTISPLPAKGRPKDFSGAVGDYQFIFNANPVKVKVGDPITLRMDINGIGNFNTVLIPRLEDLTGFKVYEPTVKTEARTKSFTQVLIPEIETITQTPKAIFSYFDTIAKTYKTIVQGPVPLLVEKGKEEEPAQVVGPMVSSQAPSYPEEAIKRDIIYIKSSPGRLARKGYKVYKNKAFLGFLIGLLVFLIGISVLHARNERLRLDTRYARRIKALSESRKAIKKLKSQIRPGNQKAFYRILFEALQGYLGDRLHIPTGGITKDVVDSTLGPKGVNLIVMGKVNQLFDICDQARFSVILVDELGMRDSMKSFIEIVNYFEREKL